jgi:hypothetical protein
MKTERDSFAEGLFTSSRPGPVVLTQKAIEDYLSEGRRIRSDYAVNLFIRLWRLLKAVFHRASAWRFAINKNMGAAPAKPYHGFFRGKTSDIKFRHESCKWDKTQPFQPCG